jgi:hypothetical protein
MSWLPSIGEIVESISNAVDRYLARDEKQRIAAARARAVYKLRLAEQEAAAAAAKVDAARAAAVQAAEAADLYESAEAERAASAADGREP